MLQKIFKFIIKKEFAPAISSKGMDIISNSQSQIVNLQCKCDELQAINQELSAQYNDILTVVELKSKSAEEIGRNILNIRREIHTKNIEIARLKRKAGLVESSRPFQFNFLEQYNIIKSSILFDEIFYTERYPQLVTENVNPILHYLRHGAEQLINPHPLFDTAHYRKNHPDLDFLSLNPLVHFLLYGMVERSSPNPLFDVDYYLKVCPEAATFGIDPISHYLLWGFATGVDPHPLFSGAYYLSENPDVARAGLNPLAHFLVDGRQEGRLPHPAFLAEAYFLQHPGAEDEIKALELITPFEHWLTREGGGNSVAPKIHQENIDVIDPDSEVVRDFDERTYLLWHKDVADAVSQGFFKNGKEHWLRYGHQERRMATGVKYYAERKTFVEDMAVMPYGVNYHGLFMEPNGLGECARQCHDALSKAGVATCQRTVLHNRDNGKFTLETAPHAHLFRINIFNLNADMFSSYFSSKKNMSILNNRYNIGMWFWELCSFRPDWLVSFGALDEMWAASNFIRDALALNTSLPVHTMRIPVEPDRTTIKYNRKHFGIPENVFVFAHIFDVGSLVERKNPFGLIKAYKNAFGNRKDVMLILKYHSTTNDHNSIKLLISMSQGANVKHIPWLFTDAENISFKHVIDCFVSPHRSEGFGLNIAESMYFSKPVIATAYSANMDFMDDSNSYLLNYHLCVIKEQAGPYLPGYVWAEPDLDHLVDLMRHIFANPDEAAEKAARGAQKIRNDYSKAVIGKSMRLRLEELGLNSLTEPFLDRASFRQHWGSSRKISCPTLPALLSDKAFNSIEKLPILYTISVIVPVYNIQKCYLEKCIDSVLNQSYPFFELCLYDDGSTLSETLDTIEKYRYKDPRIKIKTSKSNCGISEASNEAVHISTGQFIAFLDNDDEYHPDALLHIAQAINEHPDVDFLYTDEDKIELDGSITEDYCKPCFSPEHLLSCMYILHIMIIRKSVFFSIGGFRKEYTGAQDYDLVLRLTRFTQKIVHIPHILYHWRKIPGSAAAVIDAKPRALENARLAVEDHARALFGPETEVTQGKLMGLYRVRPSLNQCPPVTLVIPTNNKRAQIPGRGDISLLDNFVTSILEKTTYKNYRILIVDNGNVTTRQRKIYRSLPVNIISYSPTSPRFNYASKANFSLKYVNTENFVLLNDDMEIISDDWLEALLEFSTHKEVGVVGGKLIYPDDRIQHCGIVMGLCGDCAHVFHGIHRDAAGYNGFVQVVRNYSAVTGACFATKKEVVRSIGGFDENFAQDFADIDFCLNAHALGMRNVYTPFCEMYHFEGITAKRSAPDPAEAELFRVKWKQYIDNDPYFNPNFSRDHLDFRLKQVHQS